jgi:hypothetical protein
MLLRPYIIKLIISAIFVLDYGFLCGSKNSVKDFNSFRYTYLKEEVRKP